MKVKKVRQIILIIFGRHACTPQHQIQLDLFIYSIKYW